MDLSQEPFLYPKKLSLLNSDNKSTHKHLNLHVIPKENQTLQSKLHSMF